MSVAEFYRGWAQANATLAGVVAGLSDEELALPVGQPSWPVWASVAHVAGGRVYWLCHVVGEPGVETTPFADPEQGWEDDLTHPRRASELVGALDSSFRIVERCLETWTPDTLRREVPRTRAGATRIHTLQSILWRLITHDAYHSGEIALVLGSHGYDRGGPNGPIDLWAGLSTSAQ